ncbi:hypothetical protein [Bradyrhizobium sp. McL0616]|uniref:ATP dependent DNA ligase n=1 Tax=Bradyrhizobium sp. McL0616 TaxID=3415674 RepID=UPI003CE821F5
MDGDSRKAFTRNGHNWLNRFSVKVGTGWNRTTSAQIRKALDTVVSPKAKLTKPIKKPKATWVEPKFFAEVEFRDITSEGLLRASSFKGCRSAEWAFKERIRMEEIGFFKVETPCPGIFSRSQTANLTTIIPERNCAMTTRLGWRRNG